MQSLREIVSPNHCRNRSRVEGNQIEKEDRGSVDSARGWRIQADSMEVGIWKIKPPGEKCKEARTDLPQTLWL